MGFRPNKAAPTSPDEVTGFNRFLNQKSEVHVSKCDHDLEACGTAPSLRPKYGTLKSPPSVTKRQAKCFSKAVRPSVHERTSSYAANVKSRLTPTGD